MESIKIVTDEMENMMVELYEKGYEVKDIVITIQNKFGVLFSKITVYEHLRKRREGKEERIANRIVKLYEEGNSSRIIVGIILDEFGRTVSRTKIFNILEKRGVTIRRRILKDNIVKIDKKYLLRIIIKLYIGSGKTVGEIQRRLRNEFRDEKGELIRVPAEEIEDLLKEASVYIPKGIKLDSIPNEKGRSSLNVIKSNFKKVIDAYLREGNYQGALSILYVWRDSILKDKNEEKDIENEIATVQSVKLYKEGMTPEQISKHPEMSIPTEVIRGKLKVIYNRWIYKLLQEIAQKGTPEEKAESYQKLLMLFKESRDLCDTDEERAGLKCNITRVETAMLEATLKAESAGREDKLPAETVGVGSRKII